jgi:hypothetical protein
VYRILVGRPDGKKPLGNLRRDLEDNIKIDLQEMGWGGGWILLSWLKMEQMRSCCECGIELRVFLKCREFLG